MKRTAMAAVVLAIAALAGTGSGATDGPAHIAVGNALLPDGLSLSIRADEISGTAWLTRDPLWVMGLQISLQCVAYEFVLTPYPSYPNGLPFHRMHASGLGSDGETYYLSVFDTDPAGVNLRDTVSVSTTPGTAACGGSAEGGPVASGDFTIAG